MTTLKLTPKTVITLLMEGLLSLEHPLWKEWGTRTGTHLVRIVARLEEHRKFRATAYQMMGTGMAASVMIPLGVIAVLGEATFAHLNIAQVGFASMLLFFLGAILFSIKGSAEEGLEHALRKFSDDVTRLADFTKVQTLAELEALSPQEHQAIAEAVLLKLAHEANREGGRRELVDRLGEVCNLFWSFGSAKQVENFYLKEAAAAVR